MLSRFVPFARRVNSVATKQAVRCMGQAPAHWKTDKEVAIEQKASMNDLPVPEGSWQEHYNKRNASWNIQIGVAALVLTVTVFAMNQFNCFYLHDTPPLRGKKC